MKRLSLHIAFWSVYFVQSVLLIFLVNLTRLQKPVINDLALAAANCLVILLPKILFTYLTLYILLNRLTRDNLRKRTILHLVLALGGAVFFYRVLVVFVVNPLLYHWTDHLALFDPLGILVALMDIGFVSGFAIVLKQLRLQYAAGKREETLIREKLEAELRFLRSQTNPHFLFNTLNNIYALARKKSDQTPDVVMRLSKLLRFMLYESAKPLIKIEDEVKILDDYIELEKIRFNSRLTVNFYREIDNMHDEISPLLLLPFVENAFKHGPGNSHFDAYIHIDMILLNGTLNFSVENTKEQNEATGLTGNIGLQNVRRQLELLYPEYSMHVTDGESLFTVFLSINLKTHEKNNLSYTGR